MLHDNNGYYEIQTKNLNVMIDGEIVVSSVQINKDIYHLYAISHWFRKAILIDIRYLSHLNLNPQILSQELNNL